MTENNAPRKGNRPVIHRTQGAASISMPRQNNHAKPQPKNAVVSPNQHRSWAEAATAAKQASGIRPVATAPTTHPSATRPVVRPQRPAPVAPRPAAPQRPTPAQPQRSMMPSRRPAHRTAQKDTQLERREHSGIRYEHNIVKQLTVPVGTPKLRIYPLGGLEEIGRNCMVFEMGDDIVIVDAGLMFPEEGMPGIDYIIPNVSSLKGKEKNIRGIIITHGHMDHVGGLPHLLPMLNFPTVFTAPLSAGIIRKRQEEYGNANLLKIQLITVSGRIQLGKHFSFEPFHVNHTISDAFGAAIHTPYGTVIMTGDFKFDFTPIEDDPADLTHIAMFGIKGVLMLMSDSTNAESPGHQLSETHVMGELDKIFQKHDGRLIIGTFSSLLTRVQQIIWLCEKHGRKLLVEGRSMRNNIEIAHQLGYMKIKPGTIIEEGEARRLPDNKLAVVCTGAQGEKNAVLMRIANSEHKYLRIKKGDGVIFSSSVIPGNERTVQNLKDTLVKQGAFVYHNNNMDIHASGHAKQEDLKLMLRLTRPKYFMPVHGNRFMLETHGRLATETGVERENVFISENGQITEVTNQGAVLTEEKVDTGYVMVDGLGVGDVSEVVLRDRVALAEDGIFVVIATIRKQTGELIGSPDIISRGFVYMKDSRELVEKARAATKKILKDNDKKSPAFDEHLRNKLRNDIGQILWKATERRPMVLPVIIEV